MIENKTNELPEVPEFIHDRIQKEVDRQLMTTQSNCDNDTVKMISTGKENSKHRMRKYAMVASLALAVLVAGGASAYAIAHSKGLDFFFKDSTETQKIEKISNIINQDYVVGNHTFTVEKIIYNKEARTGYLSIFVQSNDGSEMSDPQFGNVELLSRDYREERNLTQGASENSGVIKPLTSDLYYIDRSEVEVDGDRFHWIMAPVVCKTGTYEREDGGIRIYWDFNLLEEYVESSDPEKRLVHEFYNRFDKDYTKVYEEMREELRMCFWTDETYLEFLDEIEDTNSDLQIVEAMKNKGFSSVNYDSGILSVIDNDLLHITICPSEIIFDFDAETVQDIKVHMPNENDIVVRENGKVDCQKMGEHERVRDVDKSIVEGCNHKMILMTGTILAEKDVKNLIFEINGEVME